MSTSGEKYILMLRDDHSDYCWVFAVERTCIESTERPIIDWGTVFGVPKSIMSNGPTHFKNKTIRPTCKGSESSPSLYFTICSVE